MSEPTFRGSARFGDPSPEKPLRGPRASPADDRRKLAELVWSAWTKHKLSPAEIAARYGLTPVEVGRLLFEVGEED